MSVFSVDRVPVKILYGLRISVYRVYSTITGRTYSTWMSEQDADKEAKRLNSLAETKVVLPVEAVK